MELIVMPLRIEKSLININNFTRSMKKLMFFVACAVCLTVGVSCNKKVATGDSGSQGAVCDE